ncbi:hypothetical protein BVRB_9g211650 [Beta vulgaris subsp. vulgaris]|nr:hypothetical protein BVRB_9g211650 [Beta vulgaris subsp. vulgaris]
MLKHNRNHCSYIGIIVHTCLTVDGSLYLSTNSN